MSFTLRAGVSAAATAWGEELGAGILAESPVGVVACGCVEVSVVASCGDEAVETRLGRQNNHRLDRWKKGRNGHQRAHPAHTYTHTHTYTHARTHTHTHTHAHTHTHTHTHARARARKQTG